MNFIMLKNGNINVLNVIINIIYQVIIKHVFYQQDLIFVTNGMEQQQYKNVLVVNLIEF